MRYSYEIDSSLEWEEILNALQEEFNLEEGKILYYDSEEPHEKEKQGQIKELKEIAKNMVFEDSSFSFIFDNFEINVLEYDDKVQIDSSVDLEYLFESQEIEFS
jgi:hypothetical protein